MAWHVRAVFDEAKRYGWSDRELARRLGMNHPTVSRIKNGHIKPSLEFRERVKAVFPRHDIDKLIRWEPDGDDAPVEVPA